MSLRCLADIGGPFYDPTKPFRNWSALPFYQLDLPQPPYVDRAQLARGIRRATDHLARLQAQGYTGIVIDNLAHLVSFEHAPIPIYAPDSPYRVRAAIYRAAFGRLFDSPCLLASIKHGPSDFFRLLPHNSTLGLPGPAQIVELQNRREYELFGMVPSAVVPLHQDVVRHAGTNPRFAGVWAWNSSGGWGGGQAALADDGWSVWTELSSALRAALLGSPDMDAAAFVYDWCERDFGGEFGAAVADIYLESAALIERGWYLGPSAGTQPALGTLYVPPLLWVWWMRPTAAPAIWAYLAATVIDHEPALLGGAEAIDRLAWHAARLAELAPTGDPRAATVVESVNYLRDVIAVAHPIRALMLRAFVAAWTGERTTWDTLARQAGTVRTAIQQHRMAWARRSDLPPLELEEIDGFLWRLERAPELLWQQARAASLLVDRLRAGSLPGRRIYIAGLAGAALLALVLARQGRKAGVAGALASWFLIGPLRRRALRIAVPWLNRRLYLLPSIFFETGPSFTEWTA